MPPKEPEQIKNENQNPQPIPNLRTDELGITYDKYMKLRFAYASAHIEELGKLPSNDEVRQEYDSMTDEELMTRYNLYLSECPKHWEGQARETMERWIQNTGNPTVISDYLNKPDIPLSYEQQYLLRNILKSSAKISEQQLIAKQRMAEGKAPLDSCDVSVEPNQAGVETIELKNVHQKAYQTSGSGCWSCFFQVLASAKGLDITQEDIRGYRPNLKRKQAEEVEEEAYIAHNKDGDNNAFEMGDTILSYMPNTMLSEVMISRYDETAAAEGISKEQYLQSAYDQIKKTVTHALKEEHSPVGVLISGHYTTIVGIEGDKVKFKDSVQKPGEPYNPDATHEKTLEELFGKVLSGEQPATSAIQLTYAKDIKLSKDGKTVFGVPSDYVEMYPDGSLSKQPNEIREGAHLNGEADPPTNRHGFQVSRYGRVEDTRTEQEFRKKTYNNIIMTERVYLPKKLDTAYLKKQAEERTLEEENRLRQIDRDEFGMDRKPLKKSDIQQEKKAEQDLDNLPQNSSTQRKLREQFDQKLAQKREEAAQQRVLDAVEPTRMEGLKKGFADIRDGKHPELFDLQFMTNPNYKMENLQDADLQKCEDLIVPIFGEDIRHTDIIRMESVLSKFTYKKTPDSQPVNLADDVRSRLQAMPKYQKAGPSDETVFKYVKAELMHLMTVKDAALTYENGENSLRDIYNPVPVISPEEKIAAASQPVKDKDKRFVQKLQESNIPHADATNLYQTVVGLGNDELNNLVGLYKAIFTDTEKYHPSDMTFKVQPYQGANFLEDMQYVHLSHQQKPTTPPEAFNKEVWKKSETDNTMRTKANVIAKLQMAAIVIGAANNLGVKHNGKEIPSLENVVFGKEKQQKQITDKMRAADMPLTPVEGKQHYDFRFSVELIQQNLEHMLAEVEGADYSKWTRSSKQFRTMKTKLKELNKLVNVTWAEKLQRGEPITFEMMDEFVQKSDVLQEKIVDYLEHKDRQIIKDPERRNRPSKQEYEQKRIGVSLTMLDSLRKLSNEVSGAVLNTISADAKEFFSKELADEEFRRSDMDITKKQFTASAGKSLELMNLLDKETYTRKIVNTKKETLSQARERIIGAVNAVYDEKHLETIRNKDRSIGSASALAELDFSARYTKRTNAELKAMYEEDKFSKSKQGSVYLSQAQIEAEALEGYQKRLLADDPDRMQDRSQRNQLRFPAGMEEGISRVDMIFGPYGVAGTLPAAFKENGVITQEEFNQLQPFLNPYAPIGEFTTLNAALSNKDFAAIAYAAACTPEAFAKVDPKLHVCDNAEDSRIAMVSRYTQKVGSDFGKSKIGDKYMEAIKFSRERTDAALRAYQAGDKAQLAHILNTGITTLTHWGRATGGGCEAPDIEMAARMRGMLERDPELKQLALADGLKQKDIDYTASMAASFAIITKWHEAESKMERDVELTTAERKELCTDVVCAMILSDSVIEARNKQKADPVYQALAEKVQQNNLFGGAVFEYKYPPQSKLVEEIGKPGAAESLRQAVYEMVEKTGLYAVNPKTFANETRKDIALSEVFENHYGFINLLQNYKKAPRDKDGFYDIEKLMSDEHKKKVEERKKAEEKAAKEAQKKKAKQPKTKTEPEGTKKTV